MNKEICFPIFHLYSIVVSWFECNNISKLSEIILCISKSPYAMPVGHYKKKATKRQMKDKDIRKVYYKEATKQKSKVRLSKTILHTGL